MKLVEINWNPTTRQLRQFGVAAALVLPLLGWLTTGKPRTFESANLPMIGGLAVVGACLALLSFVMPGAVKPIFVGISLVTMPIGLIVGLLVMVAVYYVVFVPIGLIFRLIGRDAMHRKLDRSAVTYWQVKQQPSDVRRYFRQF